MRHDVKVFALGLSLLLGLAGEYIGRTYISASSAPQYVIRETAQNQTDMTQKTDQTEQN